MSLADDIIQGQMPDFDYYLHLGESLDDIDAYGFTPLIECCIAKQYEIAEALLLKKVNVNKPDVTGRTPLHWAVDNADLTMTRLLLEHDANPNAYTRAGMPTLVYPLLRHEDSLKHILYQHEAKLDFALDFIQGKLLGHRFELKGDADILTAENEFIELDYEGFILEFTVDIIQESLRRFVSSYSTRHIRPYFPFIYNIMDAFEVARDLLRLQQSPFLSQEDIVKLKTLISHPLLILPAASKGHALCFIRYQQWWVKIDRGENSLTEGSVNFYKITKPHAFTLEFLRSFLYKKQARRYFHVLINQELGLLPVAQLPIPSQITGNCSWANIQAAIPAAYALQQLEQEGTFSIQPSLDLYHFWVEWDKDRALDECIQRFYSVSSLRKATYCSILAAILFQTCDYHNAPHLLRAEKILAILTLPNYYYVLQSYLEEFCVKRLTRRGNNLLKILDDYGFNPGIAVTPIATGL